MKRGQKMKKIITLLLVLSLAGAMSTTALAAADGTPKSNSTNASSTNTVQITVKASGDGCIAYSKLIPNCFRYRL